MNLMHNAIKAIREVTGKIAPLYETHVGDFSVHAAHINTKLLNLSPTVIFYGVYNSGKSSLINAILGEEAAAVSDKPETSIIKAYPWGGCELIDTPGIDAPIEHEAISAEALKRADAVAFVISTSGVFDEMIIASEIVKIISMKKSLVLVLNRKSEFSERDFDDAQKLSKLESNIRLCAAHAGMSDDELGRRYYYSIVNAKSALKAKREGGKPVLLETSGIQALEALIMHVIKENTGARVLTNMTGYVENEIVQPVSRSLEAKFAEAGNAGINECFEHIKTARQEAAALCRNEVSKAISSAVEGIAGGNASAMGNFERAIGSAMDCIVSGALAGSIDFVKARLGGAVNDLESGLAAGEETEFKVTPDSGRIMEEFSVETGAGVFCPSPSGEAALAAPAPDPVKGIMNAAGTLIKRGSRQSVGKMVVKSGLKALGKGVGYMKGSAMISKSTAKSLGKSIKFLGKYAGPIAVGIDVLLSIFEYTSACERDRQECENNKKLALAAESRKKELRALMESDMNAVIPVRIDEAFSELEIVLSNALKKSRAGLGSLEGARTALNGIYNDIRIIKLMVS